MTNSTHAHHKPVTVTVSRPLSACIDPQSQRIRLEARLADNSEFHFWMSAADLRASLVLLQASAQQLGIYMR